MDMNSRIDQITKGLISLAVMLMFTVALIAGQARANLPARESPVDELERPSIAVKIDSDIHSKLESWSYLLDTFFALPIDIDIRISDFSVDDDTPPDADADKLPGQ